MKDTVAAALAFSSLLPALAANAACLRSAKDSFRNADRRRSVLMRAHVQAAPNSTTGNMPYRTAWQTAQQHPKLVQAANLLTEKNCP